MKVVSFLSSNMSRRLTQLHKCLSHLSATWDSPPRFGEPGYEAFEAAFRYLIESRKVTVPSRTKAQYQELDNRKKDGYARYRLLEGQQPKLGQSEQIKLMPFQVRCHFFYIVPTPDQYLAD